ncbi:hypothetical protein SEA_LILYPAD_84 [Gordonia phage LilyPad]|nr:hypothetical protein SEA_LILYPAD_84 [Gordonia phage LilyPad]
MSTEDKDMSLLQYITMRQRTAAEPEEYERLSLEGHPTILERREYWLGQYDDMWQWNVDPADDYTGLVLSRTDDQSHSYMCIIIHTGSYWNDKLRYWDMLEEAMIEAGYVPA